MNFLLTNDDGISAPGLWAAARALASMGSVLVVAPTHNYSGYGAAHPPHTTLSCTPYTMYRAALPNVTAYAVSSTPAACVHVGLSGALGGEPIDVVVSGVNDAPNMGRDILYSGTVGAAMTAHLMGMPAIALSLDARPGSAYHWDSAAWAVKEGIRIWQEQPGGLPVLLNINVPNVQRSSLRGAIVTQLSAASFLDEYSFGRDAHEEGLITLTKRDTSRDTSAAPRLAWSDTWAVSNGFVSVTSLNIFPDIVSDAPVTALPQSMGRLPVAADARC